MQSDDVLRSRLYFPTSVLSSWLKILALQLSFEIDKGLTTVMYTLGQCHAQENKSNFISSFNHGFLTA